MTLGEFTLACISREMSNEAVGEFFLDTHVEGECDIAEAVAILKQYRPELFERFSSSLDGMRIRARALRRGEFADVIARAIHARMLGTERTRCRLEHTGDPDAMLINGCAYDILDVLEQEGWEIVKVGKK